MMSKKALEELKYNFGLGTIGKALCDIIGDDLERLEKYKEVIKILDNALEIYIVDDEIGVENRSSIIDYEDSKLVEEVFNVWQEKNKI